MEWVIKTVLLIFLIGMVVLYHKKLGLEINKKAVCLLILFTTVCVVSLVFMTTHQYALLLILSFCAYTDALTECVYTFWIKLGIMLEILCLVITGIHMMDIVGLLVILAFLMMCCYVLYAFAPADMWLLMMLAIFACVEGVNVFSFVINLFLTSGVAFIIIMSISNFVHWVGKKGTMLHGAFVPGILIGYLVTWFNFFIRA